MDTGQPVSPAVEAFATFVRRSVAALERGDLAIVHVAQDELEAAAGHIRDSLDLWVEVGDVSGTGLLQSDFFLIAFPDRDTGLPDTHGRS